MRKPASFALIFALMLAMGCASSSGTGPNPKIALRPVKVPEARTPSATSFSSVLELVIQNTAAESITVDRIQLSSVSVGTYSILPVTERPQRAIAPGATETFKLWAQVVVQATAADGLDPITIRGTVEFLAESGGFRKVFTQQVNPSSIR